MLVLWTGLTTGHTRGALVHLHRHGSAIRAHVYTRHMEDVARRWFGGRRQMRDEPDILDDLAGQIDAIATALAPTYEAHGSAMRERGKGYDAVGLATRRFALVIRRLAESQRALLRPVWSPLEEQRIADRSYSGGEPEMSRVETDAFSFFLFGDLLLEEVATAELRRNRGTPGSWKDYLDWLDANQAEPITITARELNWVLRAARNRLVTHPADGFELGVAVGSGGSIHLASVGPSTDQGARDHDEASRVMRQLSGEVGMAHEPDAEFAELLDLVGYAGQMSQDQRRRVYGAFVLAGYGAVDLEAITRLVRDLVLTYARAAGAVT
jgi:hypothetical protein